MKEDEKQKEYIKNGRNVHVLGGHFDLALSESVDTTKGDVGVGDDQLTSAQKQKIVSPLYDRTVVRRNIQAI